VSAPGYLRPDELITVQGKVQLAVAPAHAFLAMRDDAAEQDHVNITIATPAGGYRSHAMDVDMHQNPRNYNINPALVGGLYPVGKSKHALGTEVDIAAGLSWVKKNGHNYGFTFTEIAKGDLNHAHHDGITMADGNSTPLGEDMSLDDKDKEWINLGLDYVVRQLAGTHEYADGPLTLRQIRNDIGYRDSALAKIQSSVLALEPGKDGHIDLGPILTAINGLPAATAAAVRAQLKAAL